MSTDNQKIVESNAAVVASLSRMLAQERSKTDIPFVILREANGDEAVQSLEDLMAKPSRIRAHQVFRTVDSFCAYVSTFKSDNSLLLRSGDGLICDLDYHAPDAPDNCDHRCSFNPSKSLEWQTWARKNGCSMEQIEFARFIEENSIDIADPAPATMMEVSHSLTASKKGEFVSDQRLSNGTIQLKYVEETKGQTKSGIEIPEKFTIRVPIFEGDQPVDIECLFRYRVREGKLTLWYDMHRKARCEETRLLELMRLASDKLELRLHW